MATNNALGLVGSRALDRTYVCRLLKEWGLTFKTPVAKQINKFTVANCLYYAEYVTTIIDFDWTRLKYCDECHFESAGTYTGFLRVRVIVSHDSMHRAVAVVPVACGLGLRPCRGVAERGRELSIAVSGSLSESYSITMVHHTTNAPGVAIRCSSYSYRVCVADDNTDRSGYAICFIESARRQQYGS